MDQFEASFYNQAITLAKMGHREQAYSFFKKIAQTNPQDQNLVFWLAYTAPSLETSQDLLDQAYTLDPDNPALRQANQWLTNEKLNLPQPAQGFPLFPPADTQALVAPAALPSYTTRPGDPYAYYPAQSQTMPNYNSQTLPALPYYPLPPAQPTPYYPSQALAPYQPYPTAPAYPPYAAPPYYQPYYPVPQNYARPYYPPAYYQPPVYYPPIRWGNAPANAYDYYLAMGNHYRCPYCNTPYPPMSGRRISTSGWVTFAVLITLFFPLAWVGLLMQENYLRCSYCRLLLT
jgi:hypothetical protein